MTRVPKIDQPRCQAKYSPTFEKRDLLEMSKIAEERKKRTVHLGGDDSAGQDTATNGNGAGEGALLVDVGALNGRLGGTEAQTNILIPSLVPGVLSRSADLVVEEDVRLFAEESVSRSS